MKYFISLLLIIFLILSAGCEDQIAPTSSSNTNVTQQEPANRTDLPDIDGIGQKYEAKSEYLENTVFKLQNQMPLSRNQNSLAKVSDVIKVPGDFNTIQEAVDAAGDGAVINVTGSFNENVWIDGKTNITINGGGEASVLSQEPYYAPFIIRYSENVNIKGFNLIGMVFILNTQGAVIKNNDISGLGDGIQILSSNGCTVVGNNIHEKMPGGFGTGDAIYLENSNYNNIKENNIVNNQNGWSTAISGGANNTLQNNYISNNAAGVLYYYSDQNSIKDSKIYNNNDVGILLVGSSENEIKNNESCQNYFGVLLDNSSSNQMKDVICNENYLGGIHLYNTCLSNIVINAKANYNISWEGIYLDTPTANNTVKDSEAHGNGSCDVQDKGTDNTFNNNQFGSFNCSS